MIDVLSRLLMGKLYIYGKFLFGLNYTASLCSDENFIVNSGLKDSDLCEKIILFSFQVIVSSSVNQCINNGRKIEFS